MGVEANCCRRPELGKRDLKTFRGIKQKKITKIKSSELDEKDNFGSFNQKKNNITNPKDFFNSVYANKNYFFTNTPYQNQNVSNYNFGPQSNQIYTNYAEYPVIQTQTQPQAQVQPQYENNQYINSYNIINPQQNYSSENQLIETIPTTKFMPSLPQYSSEDNNNNATILPTKYITTYSNQYTNESSSNQYNNYNSDNFPTNYSSTENIGNQQAQYIETTPFSYNEKNEYNQIESNKYEAPEIQEETQYTTLNPFEYNESEPLNYENNEIQETYSQNNIEYLPHETDNISLHSKTYEENQTQFENYSPTFEDTKYKYTESPISEYISQPSFENQENQYSSPITTPTPIQTHYISSQPKPTPVIQTNAKAQIQTRYVEPIIIKKIYVSKPKQYIERQEQYTIEPQKQEMQLNSMEKYPEIQKEPEQLNLSENEPKPNKYLKKEKKSINFFDSEEEKDDNNNNYDEIKEEKDDFTNEWKEESVNNEDSSEGEGKMERKRILRKNNENSRSSRKQRLDEFDEKESYKNNNNYNYRGQFKDKNESELLEEEEYGDEEFENNNNKNIVKKKSSNLEKNKTNVACQVPGFISSFFSKILD